MSIRNPNRWQFLRRAGGLVVLLLGLTMGRGAAVDEPQDISFTAKVDGTIQQYVEWLPAGFDSNATNDVLIALHGHGSDRWQFIRDARDECRGVRDVAARFRLIYVSPDYRAATSWMSCQPFLPGIA